MRALIDGDIIVYSVGFATQASYFWVDGEMFDTKKEAKVFCDKHKHEYDDIIQSVTPEDVTHAYYNAKKLINRICEKTGADEYEVYLTGEGNYRKDVATIQPYKGNRDTTHKPVHYEAITKYLIKTHGAEVIDGMEADDQLGIEQYASYMDTYKPAMGLALEDKDTATLDTVICTIDKDLDMITGMHYNWRKDSLYYVSPEDADKFFYTQLLTGDSTDNIRGVPQIGKVKAAKLLKGCTSNLCAYNRVRQAYLDYNRKEAEKVDEVITEEDLLHRADRELKENADLLWIQRELDTLWLPPTEVQDV